MPYSHAKVELDKLPADIREMVIIVAHKHNALVEGTNSVKTEIDRITGQTPEEKAEMLNFFQKIRLFFSWAHGKRFDSLVAIAQLAGVSFILKFLGLSPDQFQRLFDALIKIIEKVA